MALILLVDDDQAVRRLVTAMLTRLGHEVVTATNGHEALRVFRGRAFDLVITDLIMPEKEGIETIRDLRRESRVKIIAMSAGGNTSPSNYLNIAKHTGASALLPKPFSNQELKAAIESAL